MDVSVGQTAHREMAVTAEMIESYAQLTGDYNPLHFDPGFASRTRFGRLMAQGGMPPARSGRDGHAGVRHCVRYPELDLHEAGLHRRHDPSRGEGDLGPRQPPDGRYQVRSEEPGRRGGLDRRGPRIPGNTDSKLARDLSFFVVLRSPRRRTWGQAPQRAVSHGAFLFVLHFVALQLCRGPKDAFVPAPMTKKPTRWDLSVHHYSAFVLPRRRHPASRRGGQV